MILFVFNILLTISFSNVLLFHLILIRVYTFATALDSTFARHFYIPHTIHRFLFYHTPSLHTATSLNIYASSLLARVCDFFPFHRLSSVSLFTLDA